MDKPYCKEEDNQLKIGNSLFEICLDKKRGNVRALTNKVCKHQYLYPKTAGGPFQIFYCSTAENVWDASYHDTVLPASKQTLKNYLVDKKNGELSLHLKYESLNARGKNWKLPLEYNITVKQKSEISHWSINIENKEEGVIREVEFPRFIGLKPGDPTQSFKKYYILLPHHHGKKLRAFGLDMPTRYQRNHPYSIEYPVSGSMQWLEFGTDEEGLYFASLDRSVSYTILAYETGSGVAPTMKISKFPFIEANTLWNSQLYALGIHTGDWHWSADQYRSWLETWIIKPKTPSWVSELPSLNTIFISRDKKLFHKFEEVPRIFDRAQAVSNKFKSVYLVGWHQHGQGIFPEYEVNQEAGGGEELHKAIEHVHARGGKVILYLNARLTTIGTETYEKHGKNWAVIDENGEIHREGNQIVNCPWVKEWKEMLLGYTLKMLREYDVDGIHYDQVSSMCSLLCYSPHHGHRNPSTAWAGYLDLLREHRRAQRAIKDSIYFGAEDGNDAFDQYQMWGNDWAAASRTNYFPQLFSYTVPWHITLGPLPAGGMGPGSTIYDFNINAWCFVLGHRGFKIAYENLPYIDMYDAAKEAFYYGRFMDTVGLEIEADPKVNIVGKIHKGNKTIAVALWNNSPLEASITVKVDLKKLGFKKIIKKVTDLGARLSYRQANVTPSYQINGEILETRIEHLGSQKVTALHIET